MALKFNVQGLGKIEDAEININPLTVITGPNGTGKSFFTKTIYSIFRMIEDSSLIREVLEIVQRINEDVNNENFSDQELTKSQNLAISETITLLNALEESLEHPLIESTTNVKKLSKVFDDIFPLFQKIDAIITERTILLDKNQRVIENTILANLIDSIHLICVILDDTKFAHEYFVRMALPDELKENFQVSELKELTTFGKERFLISLEDHFELEVVNDEDDTFSPYMKINESKLQFFRNKPNSVFFESPAYWRVKDALIEAKLKSGENYLSGVPKYFFDLDSSLKLKSKANSNLMHIFNMLRDELKGEFINENGHISYKDDAFDTPISKNLVSFGMTNLGMLNSLIKNNVIREGSYVFIDEPETNLHPDWQVLMIQSLVALSKAGVNVIITTHSTEILKYIEVAFSNIKKEEGEDKVKELLSVNYLDTDGTSLEFDSECPIEQTKEALIELSSPFLKLYMEGA
ncbi:AAA family ATPase [Vibrio sp. 10N.261.55.A10]|uniref:AAA family ATPase n=1 Tax=Vibrio sp. 10N.261.55.A10 TaxID=3229687 RepID=UPI00354FD6EB